MFKKSQNFILAAMALLMIAGFAYSAVKAENVPLIPRETLFGNPVKAAPRISDPAANAWPTWPPRTRAFSMSGCVPSARRMTPR